MKDVIWVTLGLRVKVKASVVCVRTRILEGIVFVGNVVPNKTWRIRTWIIRCSYFKVMENMTIFAFLVLSNYGSVFFWKMFTFLCSGGEFYNLRWRFWEIRKKDKKSRKLNVRGTFWDWICLDLLFLLVLFFLRMGRKSFNVFQKSERKSNFAQGQKKIHTRRAFFQMIHHGGKNKDVLEYAPSTAK